MYDSRALRWSAVSCRARGAVAGVRERQAWEREERRRGQQQDYGDV